MIEHERLPDDIEGFIAAVNTIIRTGQVMVMGVVDKEQQLVVTSMGLNPQHIPTTLRVFADQLERQAAATLRREAN